MTTSLTRDLERWLPDRFTVASDARLHVSNGLWNGAADAETQCAVKCSTARDVQLAMQIASSHNIKVSALAGGHDWVGRALCRDGFTLDLRALNGVQVTQQDETITVGGGTRVGDVLPHIPQEYAFISGVHTEVGLTALALGGGYGKLNYLHGLVADAMLGATAVLADGSLKHVDARMNSDLFWALRGAGKNFAVVIESTYKIFKIPKVLSGVFYIPLIHASKALIEVQNIIDETGDRLSIFCSFSRLPELGFGLILELLWADTDVLGEKYTARLKALYGATTIKCGWSRYKDIYDKEVDKLCPPGKAYQMDSFLIPTLTNSIIDNLVELARKSPSELNYIMLHDFHGKAASVPVGSTAFPLRTNHFNVQVVGRWDLGDERARADTHQWLKEVSETMSQHSTLGGYPAVLGPDSIHRARTFYSGACLQLMDIKRKYDNHNLFAGNYGLI